jgi:hypothetical protein
LVVASLSNKSKTELNDGLIINLTAPAGGDRGKGDVVSSDQCGACSEDNGISPKGCKKKRMEDNKK